MEEAATVAAAAAATTAVGDIPEIMAGAGCVPAMRPLKLTGEMPLGKVQYGVDDLGEADWRLERRRGKSCPPPPAAWAWYFLLASSSAAAMTLDMFHTWSILLSQV